MATPTAIPTTDLKTMRRSSSRCSSKLMEPMERNSFFMAGSVSARSSGIVIPWNRVLHALSKTVQCALNGEIFIPRDLGNLRLNVFARISGLKIKLANLFMKLALELAAGFLKFSHEFAQLAGNFRQLPWPEHQERQ